MKKMFYILLVLLPVVASSQNNTSHLLGVFDRAELSKEPYNEWFDKNYANYTPNQQIIDELKKTNLKDITLTVFLGTWCGDSHREVPRFLKMLDALGFPSSSVKLIGLNNADTVYKQSPAREERGLHIYRVPTFIVYKKGVEVNRIVELPVESLERDLLTIVSGKQYTPNYKSYLYVIRWWNEGLLTDDNVAHMGLVNQLKPLNLSIGELNACAQTYYYAGDNNSLKAATKLFQINCTLFPDSYIVYANYAKALSKMGDNAKALLMLERALELNTNAKMIKPLLELYDKFNYKAE